MKKILIISHGLSCGGIQRASVTFANICAKKAFEVHVLSVYKSTHFYSLDDRIKFYEPKNYEKNKYMRALHILYFVRKQTNKINPDIIIGHGEWTNPFIALALYKNRKKVFLEDHMSPDLHLGFLHRFLTRRLYRKVCGVIALTEQAKRNHINRNKVTNIQVIPNFVNIIVTPDTEKENRIISVGRLSKEKGHEYLIKAFALLKGDLTGKSDWMLDIVGDGPEYLKLKALTETLNIGDRVVFHGFKLDFSEIIAKSKIFVLPSLSECFPQALIEAMALKLPCIATHCVIDSSIIVNNYNGLLVEPGNIDELATAMEKLISDEELRRFLSNNALKVKEDFSAEKLSDEYLKFILK